MVSFDETAERIICHFNLNVFKLNNVHESNIKTNFKWELKITLEVVLVIFQVIKYKFLYFLMDISLKIYSYYIMQTHVAWYKYYLLIQKLNNPFSREVSIKMLGLFLKTIAWKFSTYCLRIHTQDYLNCSVLPIHEN